LVLQTSAMEKSSGIYISVCIVNWNTRDALSICLKTIGAHSPPRDLEIIVVDNASTDGSAEMVRAEFPEVKLLPQKANVMFGPGMNIATAQATGRYLLLLNSDTEVTSAQARTMADFMEKSPKIGASSPREKDASGKLWPLRGKPPTAWRLILRACGGRRGVRRGLLETGPQESLTGSCMMIRREVGNRVGYFDPGYFFYYEDTDLLTKIREAGYELRIVPGITSVHRHATSSHNVNRGQRSLWINQGFCRYVWKHYAPSSARLTIGVAILIALVELVFQWFATLLTFALARSLRQRAAAGPAVVGILLKAFARRPPEMIREK
jgi:GT2 family glycosyltransferase